MLAFIGDIHGQFHWLNKILARLPASVQHVIQVGDCGLWPIRGEHRHEIQPEPIRRVLWIDGNHEYFPTIRPYVNRGGVGWSCVEEIAPSLSYIPRGTVLELGGWRIGFLGGADSIDRAWRTEHIDWFRDERITEVDMRRLYQNAETAGGLDLLVTHTPPAGVVEYMLQMEGRGVEREFHYSAMAVQICWDQLGRPPVICGHMHPEQPVNVMGCLVLPVNGVHLLKEKDEVLDEVMSKLNSH